MADYFSNVSWGSIASNVMSYYDSGVFQLNKYLVEVTPIDINEPGADDLTAIAGDYFIDFLGYPYQIESVTSITGGLRLLVVDLNERSVSELVHYAPYPNRIGYVYRPTKGGIILAQAQLSKLDAQARDRINNIEKGVIWENLRGIINIFDNILKIQEDDTLDPGATPSFGDRYIILDSANLHANFGIIEGVGDDDIVEYDGSKFIVFWDASLATQTITVSVFYDINGAYDKLWYYSIVYASWLDKEESINYWTKVDTVLKSMTNTVMIGQGTPTANLHVNSDSYLTTDTTLFKISGRGQTTKKGAVIELGANYTDKAMVKLIGYSNPNATFDSQFAVYTFNNSAFQFKLGLYQDENGRVGINQSSPSYLLDVSGTARITGTTTLNGITYTWPSADGTNDYVLTTNGSGTLSWSQKTGGTSGTISTLNGSSAAAQTLVGGTGLTVTDSGTGNYIHTISAASGYVIPTTTEQTNWGTAYTHTSSTSNPHSVTHVQTSPALADNSATYGHINNSNQILYGIKEISLGSSLTASSINRAFRVMGRAASTESGVFIGIGSNETDSNHVRLIGFSNSSANYNSRFEIRTSSGNNVWNTGLTQSADGKLGIGTTPTTDASSSPVLVRDAVTGEIKQTTLTTASNNYPTSLSFSASTGVLTLGRNGLTDLTTSLDGRYLTGTKVDSFNTRTGAVTLNSTDVTTALGYTPVASISSGNSITVTGTTNATISLNTPGTLTGTSVNSSSTNHTHAISGLTNSNLSGSAGITNANLANSTITIGSTAISLGGTATTIAGLTSITSTSFVGNASSATILQNSRTVGISGDGVGTATSFNGSSNITIPFTLNNVASAGTYKSVTINAKGLVTSGTNPTTLSGYGITDAQPLDVDLTAIAALSTVGFIKRTGSGTASIITDSSSNWNTAYGWGNHAGLYTTSISGGDGMYFSTINGGNPSGTIAMGTPAPISYTSTGSFGINGTHTHKFTPNAFYNLGTKSTSFNWDTDSYPNAYTELSNSSSITMTLQNVTDGESGTIRIYTGSSSRLLALSSTLTKYIDSGAELSGNSLSLDTSSYYCLTYQAINTRIFFNIAKYNSLT